MNDNDRRFLKDSGRILREAEAELDARTLSRLARARASALEGRRRPGMIPAALAGTLAGAAIGAFLLLRPVTTVPEEGLVADMELLTSEDSIEFFEEIEFYEWLSEAGVKGIDASGPVGSRSGPASAGIGSDASDGRTAGDGDAGISRNV